METQTKPFALAVTKLSSTLPRTREIDILMRQLLSSATSIGANHREANRGVSRADFAKRSELFKKKRPKRKYWLELLIDRGLTRRSDAQELLQASGKS